MSTEIAKQRSPNAPGTPLEEAIATAKRLYAAIRNASVKPDVAAKSIGYSGLNGAALTTLGTLSQYDLIDRSKGTVSVTPLALKILHPVGESPAEAIKQAALAPRVFSELHQGFHECSGDVIENHLIHAGFSPERAKKVAAVYAANKAFADLSPPSSVSKDNRPHSVISSPKPVQQERPIDINLDLGRVVAHPTQVVKTFTVPLDDGNEVELKFSGTEVGPDQLDALSEFVDFMKKRFKRKAATPAEEGQ